MSANPLALENEVGSGVGGTAQAYTLSADLWRVLIRNRDPERKERAADFARYPKLVAISTKQCTKIPNPLLAGTYL